MKAYLLFLSVFIILYLINSVEAVVKRCFSCRSRGELGTCRDPFPYNATQAEEEVGLSVVPCASGWCGKMFEGGSNFKDDDYGIATQRLCLQRGPTDNEERCAYTLWNYKKIYMCFCNGDICNGSSKLNIGLSLLIISVTVSLNWPLIR